MIKRAKPFNIVIFVILQLLTHDPQVTLNKQAAKSVPFILSTFVRISMH